MFRFQKKACTKETMGTVIKKRWNGDTWFLTVRLKKIRIVFSFVFLLFIFEANTPQKLFYMLVK